MSEPAEKPTELRDRWSERSDREKREARTGRVTYRLREGQRAFTHGENLVI